MRIKKITSQTRRDFYAIYECEHCLATQNGDGYDDDNFHTNVIPTIKYKKCGKISPESYEPLTTKYAAWEVV